MRCVDQAGAFTSFAREAAEFDVAQSVVGLVYAMKRLEVLLEDHPNNANFLEIRAFLLEESRTLGRKFSGQGKQRGGHIR